MHRAETMLDFAYRDAPADASASETRGAGAENRRAITMLQETPTLLAAQQATRGPLAGLRVVRGREAQRRTLHMPARAA